MWKDNEFSSFLLETRTRAIAQQKEIAKVDDLFLIMLVS